MTDKKTTPEADNQEQKIDIHVSLPPVVTGLHRQAYITGKKRYENAARATGEEPDENILGRYYGVLELVRRGYVHISNFDKLQPVLEAKTQQEQEQISGDIITYLVMEVAIPFEARFAFPLAWTTSLNK
jgi:hypothetical protein